MSRISRSAGSADRHGAGDGLDAEDVAGAAVVGGVVQVQAAALADGEGVGAVVAADGGTGRVDDGAGGLAEVLGQEAAGVAVGDEADVVESGLSATARPRARASSRTWSLVVSPRGNMAWASWSRVSTART